MGRPIIELIAVHKSFQSNEVVKGISLAVEEGEFLTLLGPSGCGKTTTLRMIAGFEDVTEGEVLIDGQAVNDLPPYRRPVNTVFQSYALFPHMNVYDNIAYGLTIKKMPKAKIKEKVTEALETVQLSGFEKRKQSQLSGGQKQRVAIARALVNDPKVLLLDEPLGALDFKLRKQMQIELKRLQKQLGITFIYVTHDQEEAMTMSDRIAVMHEGVIEQIDTPDNIYNHPKTRFVADFIGESNILDIEEGGVTKYLCVRPEAMQVSKEPVEGYDMPATIRESLFTGNMNKTLAELSDGSEVTITRLAETEQFMPGEKVYLWWDKDLAVTMDE